MPHPFRIETSVEIEATPEEVWEALTIGDQLDGWWIGAPNEVEPRLGGKVRQAFGGEVSESTITAWDPPRRFVDEGTPGPDGVVHAMEFTLEGRSGTTTVRFVHSGFLGDDWESEYEALAEGDPMGDERANLADDPASAGLAGEFAELIGQAASVPGSVKASRWSPKSAMISRRPPRAST